MKWFKDIRTWVHVTFFSEKHDVIHRDQIRSYRIAIYELEEFRCAMENKMYAYIFSSEPQLDQMETIRKELVKIQKDIGAMIETIQIHGRWRLTDEEV